MVQIYGHYEVYNNAGETYFYKGNYSYYINMTLTHFMGALEFKITNDSSTDSINVYRVLVEQIN